MNNFLCLKRFLYIILIMNFSIFSFSTALGGGGSGDLGGGNIIETQFNEYITKASQTLTLFDNLIYENFWLFDRLNLEQSFTDITRTLQTDEKFKAEDLESVFHLFTKEFQTTELTCKSRTAKSDKQFCLELTNFFGEDDPVKCQEYINSGRDAVGNKKGILFIDRRTDKSTNIKDLNLNSFFLHEYVQNCMGLKTLEKSNKLSSKLSILTDLIASLNLINDDLENKLPKIVGKGVNRDIEIGQKTLKGAGNFGLTNESISTAAPYSFCYGNVEYLILPDISIYTRNSKNNYIIKQNASISELSPWIKIERARDFVKCIQDFDEWNSAEVVFAIKDPPNETGKSKNRVIVRKRTNF